MDHDRKLQTTIQKRLAYEHPLHEWEKYKGQFEKPYRGVIITEVKPVVGQRIHGWVEFMGKLITTSPVVKILKENVDKQGINGWYRVETANTTYDIHWKAPESEQYAVESFGDEKEQYPPAPQPKAPEEQW